MDDISRLNPSIARVIETTPYSSIIDLDDLDEKRDPTVIDQFYLSNGRMYLELDRRFYH